MNWKKLSKKFIAVILIVPFLVIVSYSKVAILLFGGLKSTPLKLLDELMKRCLT